MINVVKTMSTTTHLGMVYLYHLFYGDDWGMVYGHIFRLTPVQYPMLNICSIHIEDNDIMNPIIICHGQYCWFIHL